MLKRWSRGQAADRRLPMAAMDGTEFGEDSVSSVSRCPRSLRRWHTCLRPPHRPRNGTGHRWVAGFQVRERTGALMGGPRALLRRTSGRSSLSSLTSSDVSIHVLASPLNLYRRNVLFVGRDSTTIARLAKLARPPARALNTGGWFSHPTRRGGACDKYPRPAGGGGDTQCQLSSIS